MEGCGENSWHNLLLLCLLAFFRYGTVFYYFHFGVVIHHLGKQESCPDGPVSEPQGTAKVRHSQP